MISFLSGEVIIKNKNNIVLLTFGGVGYSLSLKAESIDKIKIGEKMDFYTYMKVSENSMELFGFEKESEKDFFELLLSVKGVGPRSALNILGLGSIEEIKSAIARNDVNYLIQVSGMGKRTAERLCVELKNKVSSSVDFVKDNKILNDKLGEVAGALVSMGYSKEQARNVIKKLDDSKSIEELLRDALKNI